MDLVVLGESKKVDKQSTGARLEDAQAHLDDVLLINSFETMVQFSQNNHYHNVILDDEIFKTESFNSLSIFYKVFYKNRFDFVLSFKTAVEGCLYSKVLQKENFLSCIKDNKGEQLRIDENILVLDREDKGFVVNNAALLARFKSVDFVKYDRLFYFPKWFLRKFLAKNKIDRLLFILPYRNILKKTLLEKAKKIKFPFYIFERGALPNCFIFDDKGFNYDSPYYSQENWNVDYSSDEKKTATDKIDEVKKGLALEVQAETAETQKVLHDILERADGREILFAPLQRPWDSVIRYFNPRGYKNFIKQIIKFSNEYNKDYFVVMKKHPLEKKWPFDINSVDEKNIYLVNDSAHINSILKISFAVALINSGVGVLALIFQKKVFYFGKIFYKVEGCNESFTTSKNLFENLSKDSSWNQDLALKFLTYLYTRYYSWSEKSHLSFSQDLVYKYLKLKI